MAGLVGSKFTTPSIPTWYANLVKPAFTPPSWVFFPVWSTLYILMGISLYLVWRKGLSEYEVRQALLFFALQLTLNSFWSIAFFGFRSPLAGFVVIAILWAMIVLTLVRFSKLSKSAGILLWPYLFWVSFASVLNFWIWRFNS